MVDHFCVRKEVSPKVGGRAGRGLSLTVTPGDAAVSEGGGYRKGRGAPPPPLPAGCSLQLCGGSQPLVWRAGFHQLAVENVGGEHQFPYLRKWLKDAHSYLHLRSYYGRLQKTRSFKNKYVKHTENTRCCTNVDGRFYVKICPFEAVSILNL